MAKDRVSIGSKYNSETVPAIDSKKYLGLEKPTSTRDELYMYALALGVGSDEAPTPAKSNIGFANTRSIPHDYMSQIKSLLVADLIETNELDEIANNDRAIELADQYANLGFSILAGEVDGFDPADDESSIWDALVRLDEKYSELFDV